MNEEYFVTLAEAYLEKIWFHVCIAVVNLTASFGYLFYVYKAFEVPFHCFPFTSYSWKFHALVYNTETLNVSEDDRQLSMAHSIHYIFGIWQNRWLIWEFSYIYHWMWLQTTSQIWINRFNCDLNVIQILHNTLLYFSNFIYVS